MMGGELMGALNDQRAASSTKSYTGKPGKRKKSCTVYLHRAVLKKQGAPTLNTELETSFKMVTYGFLVSNILCSLGKWSPSVSYPACTTSEYTKQNKIN